MLVRNLGVGVNLFAIHGKHFATYHVDYINPVISDRAQLTLVWETVYKCTRHLERIHAKAQDQLNVSSYH